MGHGLCRPFVTIGNRPYTGPVDVRPPMGGSNLFPETDPLWNLYRLDFRILDSPSGQPSPAPMGSVVARSALHESEPGGPPHYGPAMAWRAQPLQPQWIVECNDRAGDVATHSGCSGCDFIPYDSSLSAACISRCFACTDRGESLGNGVFAPVLWSGDLDYLAGAFPASSGETSGSLWRAWGAQIPARCDAACHSNACDLGLDLRLDSIEIGLAIRDMARHRSWVSIGVLLASNTPRSRSLGGRRHGMGDRGGNDRGWDLRFGVCSQVANMMSQLPSFGRLLVSTPQGLYCPAGDFHIDPWSGVDRAIITHAHSDHARSGSKTYLAAEASRSLLQLRLGASISLETLSYGQRVRVGEAIVSLHPAGHILGSAQVRIEVDGRVAVVSGDYKRQCDKTCAAWEPVRCNLLVTESAFGLPVFRWQPTDRVIQEVVAWWQRNQSEHRPSLLFAYAVGKSQRLIAEICAVLGSEASRDMYVHGALLGPNSAYREAGVAIPELSSAASMPKQHDWSRALIFAPPSALNTPWMDRFRNCSTAMASGWMGIRGTRRRRAIDRGFVLSDHGDWQDLLLSIEECSPEEVWVTHGFSGVLSRYQTEVGRCARVVETHFSGEDDGAVHDQPPSGEVQE